MKSKERNYKDIIKSNIILFLSYIIIITFIFSLIVFWVKYKLAEIHNDLLTICLSLISAILIYHSLHFACKSSTIEALKGMKLDKKSYEIFFKRMNLVFILCILCSIVFSISYIALDRLALINQINSAYEIYSISSIDFANKLVNYIESEYNLSILSKLYAILIFQSTSVISFLSLIPYQKKVLEKFNK